MTVRYQIMERMGKCLMKKDQIVIWYIRKNLQLKVCLIYYSRFKSDLYYLLLKIFFSCNNNYIKLDG